MKSFTVITNSIEIKNLKNVHNGIIEVCKEYDIDSKNRKADIVGVYGQNGSGKTTIIQALDLFKKIASGEHIWNDMNYCISVDRAECQVKLGFFITVNENKYKSFYTFKIAKKSDDKCYLAKEILEYSKEIDDKWTKTVPIFKCNYDNDIQVFEPKIRYDSIIKSNKENAINIPVAIKLSQERKTSFLFSDEFINILENSNEKELFEIVSALRRYAVEKLFVIQNAHNGIISLNIMPLAVLHSENDKRLVGEIPITLQEPMITNEKTYNVVFSVIENMNVVINALVPGLSIGIKDYGKQLMKDGAEGYRYELISKRDGKEFPIRYESEGIKKILSILSIIIAMYNDSSVFIAIDEFDASIFESLLGTLLCVIEETGKGQLLFTSHNLRPLELLNRKSLVFTTTNPENRYIRLKGVQEENNLRDMYLRALRLGGQNEQLSTEFRESEIRRALRKAGNYGN